MNDAHHTGTHTSWASPVVDPLSRAAVFALLRPALDALSHTAGADYRLSPEARRVLRAVTRTRPDHRLALADLAARASTAKNLVPAALTELETRGYLARLACIAPHLSAALPPYPPAGAAPVEPGEVDSA